MRQTGSIGLRAYAAFLHGQAPVLTVVTVLSLVAAGAALSQPLVVRAVIDGVPSGRPMARLVMLLVALVLAAAAVNAVRDYLLQRTAERLVRTVRRSLADHLMRLPIAEYDRRRTGDLLSRVSADSTMVRVVVTGGLFDLAAGVLMVAVAAAFMVVIDPVLFAVAAAGAAAGLLVTAVVARRLRPLAEQAQARLGEMTSATERAIGAARTIRAARAENRESEAIGRSADEAYAAGLRQAKMRALIGPTAAGSAQGAFLMVLGVGGARAASGAIALGDLASFILFLFFLIMPLIQAVHAYAQLQAGLGALQRIAYILAIPTEAGHAVDPGETAEIAETAAAVAFERVSFGYNGAGPVLNEVSFTVPAGSRTALVGPSGAGKTTVLALLERFYDADSGTIRIGGTDIRELPTDQLRARLGYVEQDAPVLAGTIRENLVLATPDATDEQLLAVLDQVNLADLVQRGPHGLDTPVGERGVLLSGGERQRLAIARALLADPPILLLDEPTSNLDARNEAALRRAVDAVSRHRTTIVVAHRLSTVVDADQIVVLDHGEVVAAGRHEELTNDSELYRELAANQFLAARGAPRPVSA